MGYAIHVFCTVTKLEFIFKDLFLPCYISFDHCHMPVSIRVLMINFTYFLMAIAKKSK